MPIEGISNIVKMPRLGKIHLGIKVQTPGKTPYPRPTDYFVVPEEVATIFGERPKELEIMFPTEDPNQFAQQWLRRYSFSQGLVCIGDGVSARRKIDTRTGTIAGRDTRNWEWKEGLKCNPQDCEEYLVKRCRRVMNLLVLIPRVPGLGVWQIDTSSFYSIVNINSMVSLLTSLAGRCSFIPLKLCLGPIEVTPPGENKKTVHIMHVRQDKTLAEIAQIGLKPAAQILSLPEPEVDDMPEDLFPKEIMAEDGTEPEELSAIEQMLDGEDVKQEEKGRDIAIERDVSLIKTKTQFYRACHDDFGLQPKQALKMTGYSSDDSINDWVSAYLNVAAAYGVKVIEPTY
jgi:hypothetical protein